MFTLASFKMQFRSHIAIQPSRQPGTSHLFDIDPTVITGTVSAKIPIGIKGLFPKAKWSYTSSAMIIIPSFLAISAICSFPVREFIRFKRSTRIYHHVTNREHNLGNICLRIIYTHFGQMIMWVHTPTRVTGIYNDHRNRVLISKSLHGLKISLPASVRNKVEMPGL